MGFAHCAEADVTVPLGGPTLLAQLPCLHSYDVHVGGSVVVLRDVLTTG